MKGCARRNGQVASLVELTSLTSIPPYFREMIRPCAANAAEPSPAVLVEAGHPKVRRTVEGEVITYDISAPGSCFDFTCLAYMTFACGSLLPVIFISAEGASWSWWLYALVAPLYVMIFFTGLAFVSRYSMRLTPERLRVRAHLLPSCLGCGTWELATGADVVVRRNCRDDGEGVSVSIAVSSQGQDIGFGSVFGKDIVAFLIAAIQDYYNSEAAPAPAQMDDIAIPSC